MADAELYRYLSEFLTDKRKQTFEEVLDMRTRHLIVAVEDLHKEQNASAVVRTCDCLGIQELHIIEQRNPYRVSEAVSMGSERWLDIHTWHEEEDNSLACIRSLRARGYRIVATSPHQSDTTPEDFPIDSRAAIFFGGEKTGLSDTVMAEADSFIRIPTQGFTESLNISVSAAIILYEALKRLRESATEWQLSEDERMRLRVIWAKATINRSEDIVKRWLKMEEEG